MELTEDAAERFRSAASQFLLHYLEESSSATGSSPVLTFRQRVRLTS